MKKTQPTRRQAAALSEKRGAGNQLRKMWQELAIAAGALRRAQAQPPTPGSRGVDRVPVRLRGLAVEPEWVHQHAGHPYTPYVNPDRDLKPGARLRRKGL